MACWPLATCFPGMIYRVMNPGLENPDAAYPSVVAAVVPTGLRGLVVAAVISAIMSTVSGLVNSTSTLVTLDLVQRWKGRDWSEARLVRVGRLASLAAMAIAALVAPSVEQFGGVLRYFQNGVTYLATAFIYSAVEILALAARDILAALSAGSELEEHKAELAKLVQYTPIDIIGLRRQIADQISEAGKYVG